MSSDQSGTPEFGRRPAEIAKPASEALRSETGVPGLSSARRSRASRSQFVVFLNFLMSLAVVAAIVAGALMWIGKREFEAPGPLTEDKNVLVKEGAGWATVASQLATDGIISNARIFRIGVQASDNEADLKAGEYQIKAGSSMREVMELLKSGKSVMFSLTIPEGLTVEQALQRVASAPELSGDMPTTIPAEGTLAADTQLFTRGTPRQAIIDKMAADQTALIDEIWAKRKSDLPIADVNEFVTLASIVEKETGIAAERPQVAAVFINRLNKGMRLQSDPTILYGLFGGKGRPADRPIYQSDIQKPTPYNTYTIDGLPPGPIANPGRAALEAVANPADTQDLYFVADGTGGHVFAATLEEHNKNVAKWRAIQKNQANDASKPADAQPAQQ